MIRLILNWIKGLSRSTSFTGLIEDPRWTYEKNQDWLHEERVVGSVANPFGNTQILESPYPYENQNQTSSCVAHGVGLALAIERKLDKGDYERLSWIYAYRLRSNYPQAGSWPQGMFDIYKNYGAPLYTTLPNPQTEDQANAIVLTTAEYNEAAIYKGLNYFTISAVNIDTVASVTASGHAVPIVFYSTQDEWGRDYPVIEEPTLDPATAEIRHDVCVLPNSGFILNGVKYVTIQDSAWFGGKKIRHLSETFFNKRVYGAGYWDTVNQLGLGPRPKYKWSIPLKVGSTGEDVRQIQLLFISEGLLPNDCATGYFGGRTLAGLHAFQTKYMAQILTPIGLDKPTDLWGNASISFANQLCA